MHNSLIHDGLFYIGPQGVVVCCMEWKDSNLPPPTAHAVLALCRDQPEAKQLPGAVKCSGSIQTLCTIVVYLSQLLNRIDCDWRSCERASQMALPVKVGNS